MLGHILIIMLLHLAQPMSGIRQLQMISPTMFCAVEVESCSRLQHSSRLCKKMLMMLPVALWLSSVVISTL
eukprot:12025909-Karenia_brevis.AAC.1